MSAAPVIGQPVLTTPFKFLDYYDESDVACFAGRDREIAEIADAVAHAPTLIVYGKSGLGKTSLFLAGVFPELIKRNYLPVHVRTLQNPISDVLREVRAKLPPEKRQTAPAQEGLVPELVAALRLLSEQRPVVLVLDQFEEFFIRFRGDRQAYEAFIGAIGALAADRLLPVHVVFSLREEYLADLDDFRSRVSSLFENEYRLRPMTAFGVRQAITRPLDVAGIPYDPRLVSRLVDRLSRDRFDSVFLQMLCQEVFARAVERDSSSLRLTEGDLQDAGDIDGIFRRYLDEMAKELHPNQHLQARVVLRLLTTQERTKQALRVQDFATGLYQLTEDEILQILDVIKRSKLLRDDKRGDETWYELTHERLVPILDEWLRLDQQFNKLLAAHDWIATPSSSNVWREAPQHLLAPGHLTEVVGPFKPRLALGATELEFVFSSALYHQHEDVVFWAERLGIGKARGLILKKLDDQLDRFRQGAAFTAGLVSAGDDATLKKLVEVTLTDHAEKVRREAGRALGQIGTAETRAALCAALRVPATRAAALQTLGDLYGRSANIEGFSAWYRFRARRIAKKRALDHARTLINDAAREGRLGALFGAVTWTLSVALFYGIFLSFVLAGTEGETKLFWFVLCVGSALLGSIGIGGTLSIRVSRAVAARAVLTGDDNWGKALWSSKAFLTVPTLYTAFIVVFALGTRQGRPRSAPTLTEVLALLVPTVYWLLVPLWVRTAQRALSPGDLTGKGLGISLLTAAGIPIGLPSLVLLSLQSWSVGTDGLDIVAGTSVLAIPLASGLTACLAASLFRMWSAYGTELCRGKDVQLASRPLRWLLPVCACVGPLVVLGRLGWDGIPLVSRHEGVLSATQKSVVVSGPVNTHTRSLFDIPQYRRFDLNVKDGHAAIVRVRRPLGCYSDIRLDGEIIGADTVVAMRGGSHEVAVEPQGYTEAGCKVQLDFLEPVRGPEPVRDREANETSATLEAGSYTWVEWRGPEGDAAAPAPGSLGSLPAVPTPFTAKLSGDTSPHALVALELTKTLLAMAQSDSSSEPVARCENGRQSFSLSIAQHRAAWTPLGLDDGRTVCLVRADSRGKWTTELSMHVAERSSDTSPFRGGYRSLVRWSAPSRSPRADDPPVKIDASFMDLGPTNLAGEDLRAFTLLRAKLGGADLSKAKLRGVAAEAVALVGANLEGADFTAASLDFADLSGAAVGDANFRGASLRGAILRNLRVAGSTGIVDFTNADLEAVVLTSVRPIQLQLAGAKLQGAELAGVDFAGSDLSLAILDRANLAGANLAGTKGLTREQLATACADDGDGKTATPPSVIGTPWGVETLRPCLGRPSPPLTQNRLAVCLDAPIARAPGSSRDCLQIQLALFQSPNLQWLSDNQTRCSCQFDSNFSNMLESGRLQ
jgi:uncharacterized protein YjbI with pentapeptide repeats